MNKAKKQDILMHTIVFITRGRLSYIPMKLFTILPPIFAIASDVPFEVAILGNGKSAILWYEQANFGYQSEWV